MKWCLETFEQLKEGQGYSSMTYLSFDAVADYEIINESPLLLKGYNESANMYQLHYQAESAEQLKKALSPLDFTYMLPFVPEKWQKPLEACHLEVFAHYLEYHLQALPEESIAYDRTASRLEELSDLSHACQYHSRGFLGVSQLWLQGWIDGSHGALRHAKSHDIIVAYDKEHITGFIAVAVHDEKLWICRLAVKPEYHRQGWGTLLMKQALSYGNQQGAKSAYLMADQLNIAGRKLYENFGFVASEEYQIDMFHQHPELVLDHYLGKAVQVKMDRPMGSKHPKFEMIYPINYGFLPYTLSGDGDEIDAYVLGPQKPLELFSGKVIAIVKRKDDDEEKLVVADRMYEKTFIEKQIAFTEQYYNSQIIMEKKI